VEARRKVGLWHPGFLFFEPFRRGGEGRESLTKDDRRA
jgi:hypothetical protein